MPRRLTLSSCFAVGDLHGDWAKAVGSLRAANVIRIDGDDIFWTGGDTVVVQLGDVLDRGDHEIGECWWRGMHHAMHAWSLQSTMCDKSP